MRIIQCKFNDQIRIVVMSEDNPHIIFLNKSLKSTFDLFNLCINEKLILKDIINANLSSYKLTLNEFLTKATVTIPVFNHDLSRVIFSGVGLTHKNSVLMRRLMHLKGNNNEVTSDIEKIYLAGIEHGKPNKNEIGARPEWFYKGDGHCVKAKDEEIAFYEDGAGEEAELVAVYIISKEGTPVRLGFCIGNEFSNHKIEKENLYYLARSKIIDFSVGPELLIGDMPNIINGYIEIIRKGKPIWESHIKTGSDYMIHSLKNIESHVFSSKFFLKPGDIHYLFLGADKTSFQDNIKLQNKDHIRIKFDCFNIALENTILNKQADLAKVLVL